MQRNGIAGSYGSSTVKFLMKLHSVLHSGCANLHFHQQYQSVPFFLILANTCYFLYSDNCLSDRCGAISHFGFDLDFPND